MKNKIVTLIAALVACVPFCASAQLYDLVVAQDGTGDYTTIQDAVLAIRDYKPEGRQRILVRKGRYEEKLVIPANKTNITIVGEDRDSTILVWHDYASLPDVNGRRLGTFRSYTLRVDGVGFECESMTIVNDAMTYHNPNWNADHKNTAHVSQAVAVHVEGDRAVFRNCRLLGFQDTVFNGGENSRQMFYRCYIEGTVDFIFGPATAWFEQCHLHALSRGYLTAASTPAHHPYGYVFHNCRVTAADGVDGEYLGRPWRAAAAVAWVGCQFPSAIASAGWDNWRDPANERTARYYEYACVGDGANRDGRVAWSRVLPVDEAATLTPARIYAFIPDGWQSTALPLLSLDVIAQFRPEGRFDSRYVAGTLDNDGSDGSVGEELVVNLGELDCTTFVEYVAAALLSREQPCATDSVFRRFVQALRYHDGRIDGYASRCHYFSDWIASGVKQGLMLDVTSTLPGARVERKKIDFMTTHPSLYPQLADASVRSAVDSVERRLSATPTCYIPVAKIPASGGRELVVENGECPGDGKHAQCPQPDVQSQVREGDIIAFVTSTKGLDVSHVGIATVGADGQLGVTHASSVAGHVVTAPSLAAYAAGLKHCIGIRVVRLRR